MSKKDGVSYDVDGEYDAVILSLVVNFVGCPRRRGDMLSLCSHPMLLKKGGLLFLVLPSACTENSRYMNEQTLVNTMKHLNFDLVSSRTTRKLYFGKFQLQKPCPFWNLKNHPNFKPSDDDGSSLPEWKTDSMCYDFGERGFPRRTLRGGQKRNNFAIILRKRKE